MPPRSTRGKAPIPPPPAQPDIYVALLLVSLSALGFGCAMLAMELNNYGWSLPGGG